MHSPGTWTWRMNLALFEEGSLAVSTTTVMPIGKFEPDEAEAVRETEPELSATVGVSQVTGAVGSPTAVGSDTLAGHDDVNTGG